jgi:1,4-alpha-glucan branching enzyme
MTPTTHHPQGLYKIDPDLRPYRDHLDYRWSRYQAARDEIVAASGSLAEFAKVRRRLSGFLHPCTRRPPAPSLTTQPPVCTSRLRLIASRNLLSRKNQGYEKFGITREGNATVYREWAPAAQAAALIGDFSNWEPVWMDKGEFGMWSVTLPDGEGAGGPPFGNSLKVILCGRTGVSPSNSQHSS